MPRIARVTVPDCPHHVTQRGNRRQQTFFGSADYAEYLDILREKAEKYDIEVWAYCLMPNHVHLIVVPKASDSLAKAIGSTHQLYSQRMNQRQRWKGHVWQGRFFSFPLSDGHLLTAAKYVELNPVRANLARRPEDWPWSSARAHLDGRSASLLRGDRLLELRPNWCDFLKDGVQPSTFSIFKKHSATGRPFGDAAFEDKLEESLGRQLRARPRGRPKKNRVTLVFPDAL